jgi:hypothetical protein
MSCGSFGTFVKLAVEPSIADVNGVGTPATFDSASERYEILAENMRYTDQVVGGRGLTGTLDPIANHLRVGVRLVVGRILFEVGANELVNWLPRILHNAASGTTYSTGPNSTQFPVDIMIKRDQGTVIYRHCIINRALFSGRSATGDSAEEQVLQMALDFVGKEEHSGTWPGTEPALPTGQRLFWLFGDCDLTLGSGGGATDMPIDAFNLLIDNQMQVLTRNSLKATCLRSRGRAIRLQAPTPLTAATHTNFYLDRFDGSGVLRFRGTKNLTGQNPEEDYATTFTFARLYQTLETPATRGRSEIPLSLDLTAYRTNASEPLVVTNVLT